MPEATYFHAGCPVCVSAEESLVNALGASVDITRVHLGEQPAQIGTARAAGVRSVPALVMNEQVFHINHGASIDDLGA
ncbi:MAG: thioredoxin family protein [Actinobacteria bacterium]|nr:thioredoxin family protein [Thermoleophilia bacterium]MCB9011994.1 thioredoxin family protein [Actinomycetota bacterium]